MESLIALIFIFFIGYILMDSVLRLIRGPYRCSCGYSTYNPDEALRHQGHAKHTME